MDLKDIAASFDVLQYLEDIDIALHTSGAKNVGEGWIGISCPFCGDHAYSGDDHCGINLYNKVYTCWICGASGSIFNLVMELSQCSFNVALYTILKYVDETKVFVPKEITRSEYCKFPKELEENITDRFIDYLTSRNYNPEKIIGEYKIKTTMPVGKYRNRIIIPFYFDGNLITYTGRTISKKDEKLVKYKDCPIQYSVIEPKGTLYNIDTVHKTAVIVEGCLDVWRIGKGCCALSGSKFSERQVRILLQKRPKSCFIMLDEGAEETADKLSWKLASFVDHVEIISLEGGDPGEFTEDDVQHFRNQINL